VFDFLKGDLVFLGGFYGTQLRHKTTKLSLVSPDSFIKQNNCSPDDYIPWGPLETFGIFNVCGGLINELRNWEYCSNGEFRFHLFGYDWRRGLNDTVQDFSSFSRTLFESTDTPIHVLARMLSFIYQKTLWDH
jgi:hypothetical protein